MYVVIGASGNTGKAVAEKLLAAGKEVKVVGRNAEHLQPFVDRGATPAVGSLEDVDFVQNALKGATAAYVMIPPNFGAENFRGYYNLIGDNLIAALKDNGVRHAVFLSSLGAELSEGTGPILGLGDVEKKLNQIEGLNIVHLRAGFFMENLYAGLDLIKNMGIMGSPLRGDLPVYMVATRDIGEHAAKRLLAMDFSGKNYDAIVGPRKLTMNEATTILGKAIGKDDLQYVQFPYEEAEKAFLEMGMSPDVARTFIEMYRSFNEGVHIAPTAQDQLYQGTTSIEEFARGFAAAYNA